MRTNTEETYGRMARAIDFIVQNATAQPSLAEMARAAGMSPFHFERTFRRWAGTTPKRFLGYVNLERAKRLLEARATLQGASAETGFSGTGRLHDLFVTIEGVTPGEYKNGGANLKIAHHIAPSPFGRASIASTGTGICHLAFVEDEAEGLQALAARFPRAEISSGTDALQKRALNALESSAKKNATIPLYLKGTGFQLKVWEALLGIPEGRVTTYGRIAAAVGHDRAHRAVGTAVGQNPIAYFIPCHRLIAASGVIGNYRWGSARKRAILGREIARVLPQEAA